MKKLIAIIGISSVLAITASAQRFGVPPSGDNTGQSVTYSTAAPTIGSTDSISPGASYSYYTMAIASAKTLRLRNVKAKKWDVAQIVFSADATNRLVTMTGTKMYSNATTDTMTVYASKIAWVRFLYDGTKWIQTGRFQQK